MPRRPSLASGLALAFVLLLPVPAAAHPSSSDAQPSVEKALQDLWFTRAQALLRDDTVTAAASVDSMKSLIRTERLDRVPWLARAFSFEGYERLREGNYERAREAFDIARRFDPRAPEAQSGYAWAAMRAGRGFSAFIGEYRRAIRLRVDSFAREGLANALIVGMVGLWLLAAAVIFVLLIRHNAMLRHDIEEMLPSGRGEGVSKLLAWSVLFAPLLLWIGGAWILLYWCVVLARYMSGSERLVAGLACLAIVATGPLAARSALEARQAADPVLLAMEDALDGGYGKEVIHFLQRTLDEDPESLAIRLLLANTYQRANLNREAFEEYQRILDVVPNEPRALNNVGSLYMKTGQMSQGLVYFGRAAEVRPDEAAIQYNLNLAQSSALRLVDAEGTLRRLQQLNPDMAQELVMARGRGEAPDPIPLWVPREEVTAYLEARIHSRDSVDWIASLGSPTAIGAMASLVLLGWSGLLSRSPTRAQICIRCGAPFCGKCKREIGARECCAQCIHLFVKKDAIAPDVRARKLRQVERFARVSRLKIRIASVLLPGTGHMLAGRTFTGLLASALWILPLTLILLEGRLILPSSLQVFGVPSLSVLLGSCLMGLTWLAANLLAPRLQN